MWRCWSVHASASTRKAPLVWTGSRGARPKEHLATNLETLHDQLVTETTSPQAVVRRLIPQGGGTFRPLGLPSLEDKIVAKAVGMLLESITEPNF